jgi:hypothetical protein
MDILRSSHIKLHFRGNTTMRQNEIAIQQLQQALYQLQPMVKTYYTIKDTIKLLESQEEST